MNKGKIDVISLKENKNKNFIRYPNKGDVLKTKEFRIPTVVP